jgi:pimeloyl-ACP methyl ester carboxylesterase
MRLSIAHKHVVLLPGLDGTGELLAPLCAELRSKVDPIQVRFPKNKPFVYKQLFPAIREVLPWGRPYSLMADSFSGHLALLFAEEQPQDIENIILCSSFVTHPEPPTWWNKMVWKDPLKAPFSEETLKKYFLGEDCPPALVEEAKRVYGSIPPEILDFRWNMAVNTQTWPQLARCRKPILFLKGSHDRVADPATEQQIQLHNPGVEILSMNGPHCLLQRSPREAAAYIDAFVSTKVAARG